MITRTETFRYVPSVPAPESKRRLRLSRKNAYTTHKLHPHFVNWLKYAKDKPLHQWLRENDNWDEDRVKPKRPKDAVEQILKQFRTLRSSAIYRNIVERVSVKGCRDLAFKALVAKRQEWFVAGGRT